MASSQRVIETAARAGISAYSDRRSVADYLEFALLRPFRAAHSVRGARLPRVESSLACAHHNMLLVELMQTS